MRPIGPAINLIHHPDEPDEVRAGVTRAGIVWGAAGEYTTDTKKRIGQSWAWFNSG
jgi:hypothetical protein